MMAGTRNDSGEAGKLHGTKRKGRYGVSGICVMPGKSWERGQLLYTLSGKCMLSKWEWIFLELLL